MTSVSFDRAASFYDATRGFAPGVAEQARDAIAERLGATGSTRLLELGVGTGRIALPFLQAGYNYTGVDIAPAMLAVLRGKLAPGAAPRLVVGDVTALPFAGGAFEAAVAVHVLHLVADWRATLREAARVLRRPGGRLLLTGEPGGERSREASDVPPPTQAMRAWRSILTAIGSSAEVGQPGIRLSDPRVREELVSLGATVEESPLGEFERPPLSARMVLQGYRDRIYSSDWARPDAEHATAVARLERWLAEECDDPDTPYTLTSNYWAVLATWR